MALWEITEPCLYNFLGYGNLDGRVWFLGVEEGGAEVWRNKTLTLEESLRLRAEYSLAMDFRHVWEDLYGIPLGTWKGATTWRYIAAFLLSLRGTRPDTASVWKYVFGDKSLGRLEGHHLLCELMPLPKQAKSSIEPYEAVWATVGRYRREVAPGRQRLVLETLKDNRNVRLLVSYERDTEDLLLDGIQAERADEWTLFKGQRYILWRVALSPSRQLHLLQTPFFGQGHISYEGIWETTNRLMKLVAGLKPEAE